VGSRLAVKPRSAPQGCQPPIPDVKRFNTIAWTLKGVRSCSGADVLLDQSQSQRYFRNILAFKSCYTASIFPRPVPGWNHLPLYVRNASSHDCFKSSKCTYIPCFAHWRLNLVLENKPCISRRLRFEFVVKVNDNFAQR